jgi:ABC-type glycerol-3-phosphate transport system substrate-binding protein
MVYFTKESGTEGLWKMPVDGGPETNVVPSVYRYNYAVTDRGIYFASDATRNQKASIQFLSFATGMATPILQVQKPLDLGLAVSPDGRTLLYTQIDSSARNLTLVENFR